MLSLVVYRRDRRTYLHARGFFHSRLQILNQKKLSLKAKQSQIELTVNAIQRARPRERLEATVGLRESHVRTW